MVRFIAIAIICFFGIIMPSFAQLHNAPPLIIRGFDTKVDDCGSQQILITSFEDIKSGFEFNISSGKYSDSEMNFDVDSDLDVVNVTYVGPDTIYSGSNICIFFYCVDKNTDIDILVDGDIKTSEFLLTYRNNSFGNKMLFTDGSRELFISNGNFFEQQGRTLLNGNVYDGLSFAESSNTVPSTLNDRDIRIPLGGDPTDSNGGERDSLYGFVLCGDFDICTGEYEITKRVNWVVAVGTSERELESLCDELCEFREEEEDEEEDEVLCEDELLVNNLSFEINNFSVCFDPKAVTKVTGINIDGVNIFNDPIFSQAYCANGLSSGCSNFCGTGIICAEPHLADDIASYFDQEGILYESIVVTQFGSGLCITINESSANIEEVIIEASNIGTQFHQFTKSFIGFEYYAEVDIDCDISEILWDDGTNDNPKKFEDNDYEMQVTVTCADGCVYEGEVFLNLYKSSLRNNNDWSSNDMRMALYPNPAKNEITIELNGDPNEELDISIVGVDGKIYNEYTYKIGMNTNGKVKHKLDISSLRNGVYFMQSKQLNLRQALLFTVMK